MKIKQWKKLIDKYYRKDKQKLLLETYVDTKEQKKHNVYYSQTIFYKDDCLCEIATFECYKHSSSLGSIPYCKRSEWGDWLITVPKFGQLTDKDIYKAIGHVLKQINKWWLWNIYLDNKHVSILKTHNYQRDSETLREFIELGINDENY